ncbi:FxSxx-COOH cyclophane-containing RiPP peptide [Streptomyces sp. NPDC005209]|uniref:FxSxx-COOH cyclophane-containing RiPP peptide n=1 Tax=Streptomyces sp. NPDC005209 TaxID=3156715 RepID=UPI0033A113C4
MDVRDTARQDTAAHGTQAREPLPDLLELGLTELRTLQHPVLREVVEDLRERSTRPSEMLWGFSSAL